MSKAGGIYSRRRGGLIRGEISILRLLHIGDSNLLLAKNLERRGRRYNTQLVTHTVDIEPLAIGRSVASTMSRGVVIFFLSVPDFLDVKSLVS